MLRECSHEVFRRLVNYEHASLKKEKQVMMKIILDQGGDEKELAIEVTQPLHDLHLKINDIYDFSSAWYEYKFGERLYCAKGILNTLSYHCDLFIFEKEPIQYHCDNLTLNIFHKNISNSIYDYCDFDNPHYCSVFGQIIDIDTCYDSMMGLNGFFSIQESRELSGLENVELAKEQCKHCIYSNCDAIDHEVTKKGLPLEEYVHRSRGVNLKQLIDQQKGSH